MRVTGSTVQTVGAVTWGLAVGLAPLAHAAPTPFWTALGIVLIVLAVVVVLLGTAKLLGDALWPDWIDRWWDPPDKP
jgi:hypothetical protein